MNLFKTVIFDFSNRSEGEIQSRETIEECVHQFGGLETMSKNVQYSSNNTFKMAFHSTNPFIENAIELGPTAESSQWGCKNFNMILSYLYSNAHNAKIYGDPLNRYCVKIEDKLIEFHPKPPIN